MGTATPMPTWDSLAARHLLGPIVEPGELRGDPMSPIQSGGFLYFLTGQRCILRPIYALMQVNPTLP